MQNKNNRADPRARSPFKTTLDSRTLKNLYRRLRLANRKKQKYPRSQRNQNKPVLSRRFLSHLKKLRNQTVFYCGSYRRAYSISLSHTTKIFSKYAESSEVTKYNYYMNNTTSLEVGILIPKILLG